MKKIKLLLMIAIVQVSFTACDSNLTEELKGDLNKGTLVSENDAFALVDGCYSTLMGSGYGFFSYGGYVKLFDGPTDAMVLKNSSLEKFRWSEDVANELWSNAYKLVEKTNTTIGLIEDLDDSSFGNPDDKYRLVGEAKFLRAFAYSLLSSAFGDVPLIIGVPESGLPSRTLVAEVIAQIKLDLNDAIEALPASHPTEIGRATKGAANTLLAKMYMREADWANAKTALDDVIAGPYDLFQGAYGDLWLESNRKDNEFIFSIMSHGEDYNTASNHHIKNFSPWGYDLGWSATGVPKEIFNAMEASDSRSSVIVNDLSNAYYGYIQGYGTAIAWQGFALLQKFSGNNRDVTAPGNPWGNYASSKLNVPIYRFADVLLMSAEVENRLNSSATAYTRINAVRSRAGVPDLAPGLSVDAFNDAVLFERAVELTGEGHRRDDLIRHGKFVSNNNAYLQAFGYADAITVEADHRLFPIPRAELNINPNMTPNPSNDLAVY